MTESTEDTDRFVNDDFQFLTDFALVEDASTSWGSTSNGRTPQDELFLERFESFIEGQMRDVQSFANREGKSLDEIRRMVAIPHVKYLFSQDLTFPSSRDDSSTGQPSTPSVKMILGRMSKALQLLNTTTGMDSLLLVVSPIAPSSNSSSGSLASESSWIGGSNLGKEFWMGLKGGGVNGARAFRIKSQMKCETDFQKGSSNLNRSAVVPPTPPPADTSSATSGRKVKSGDVKTELNAAVRQALRSASGNGSAEMRWTKPDTLEELYNVRLIGWPPSVRLRNPSNNSLNDNKVLLEHIHSGKMRFIKKGSLEWNAFALQFSVTKGPCLSPQEGEASQSFVHHTHLTTTQAAPSELLTVPSIQVSNPRTSSMEVNIDTSDILCRDGSSEKRQARPDDSQGDPNTRNSKRSKSTPKT